MACHYLTMNDSREFYSRLKDRDPDLILKMAKCVLSAYKRSKDKIDIFDITFKTLSEGLVFTIDKHQYKELLKNCMDDLIKLEAYELCAEVYKILNKKTRQRKQPKEDNIYM